MKHYIKAEINVHTNSKYLADRIDDSVIGIALDKGLREICKELNSVYTKHVCTYNLSLVKEVTDEQTKR